MSAEYLSDAQRTALDATIRQAEQTSRAEFSVYVGRAEGEPRDFATRLHRTLVAPDRSVLVLVDPDRRAVEVVTGEWVRRTLTDRQVELAVATMTSSFGEGELLDGLRRGIQQLADHARAPVTRHAEQ